MQRRRPNGVGKAPPIRNSTRDEIREGGFKGMEPRKETSSKGEKRLKLGRRNFSFFLFIPSWIDCLESRINSFVRVLLIPVPVVTNRVIYDLT